MARKRIIDPDFWLDEQLTECSLETRLFYIATWNFSDDYGVVENSAKRLKAQVFPYDDIDVQPLIDKLIEIGRYLVFEVEGKSWIYIKNFLKWQRVDKPSVKRNPKCPFDEESSSAQEPVVSEEKRREEKRREVKRSKEKRIAASDFKETIGKGVDQENLIEALDFIGLKDYSETQTITILAWLEVYPNRNYKFEAIQCKNWFESKRNGWKLPIVALGNWLSKTKPDEAILAKKRQRVDQEKQSKREEDAKNHKELTPEQRADISAKIAAIKSKVRI